MLCLVANQEGLSSKVQLIGKDEEVLRRRNWSVRQGFGQSRPSTCAVPRRRFPVGARPTGDSLQPEATGAGMEVTKCLKPSDSGHEFGDCASVQAATRVNAEQTSKRTMCRPTR